MRARSTAVRGRLQLAAHTPPTGSSYQSTRTCNVSAKRACAEASVQPRCVAQGGTGSLPLALCGIGSPATDGQILPGLCCCRPTPLASYFEPTTNESRASCASAILPRTHTRLTMVKMLTCGSAHPCAAILALWRSHGPPRGLFCITFTFCCVLCHVARGSGRGAVRPPELGMGGLSSASSGPW